MAKILSEEELRSISQKFAALTCQGKEKDNSGLEKLLDDLLHTAEARQLQSKHRAAACNAVCGFIDSSLKSSESVVLKWEVWFRIKSFYLARYQDASPRSMVQWLNTMQGMLKAHRETADRYVKWEDYLCKECVKTVSSGSDLSSIKPSIMVLEVLLSKGLIEREDFFLFLSTAQMEAEKKRPLNVDIVYNDHLVAAAERKLLVDILDWTKQIDITASAGRLFRTIFQHENLQQPESPKEVMHKKQEKTSIETDGTWFKHIIDLSSEDFTTIERLEKHILPELLTHNEEESLLVVHTLPFSDLLTGATGTLDEGLVRLTLMVAKIFVKSSITLQLRLFISQELRVPFANLLEKLSLSCLDHQSASIRASALNTLVTGDGTTQPFSADVLEAIKRVLCSLFGEGDPKIRADFSNTIKKLSERLRLTIHKLEKENTANNLVTASQHRNFVNWFQDFLFAELRPSASYQRHILSLKVLKMSATRQLLDSCQVKLFSTEFIHDLIALVTDTYDDVRSLAASLLTHAAPLDGYLFDPEKRSGCIQQTQDRMVSTGRASISDGYARLIALSFYRSPGGPDGKVIFDKTTQWLMNKVDDGLSAAEQDLQAAISRPQLHGQFIALRYIVHSTKIKNPRTNEDGWAEFVEALYNYCLRAWNVVKHILCIDSPEGHGDEEEIADLSIGVKDTLSFSWRVLKETSALLEAILDNRPLQTRDYQNIGQLCITQLSELRHRGAFSTVAQCFTSCCIEIQKNTDVHGEGLLNSWYRQFLELIDAQSTTLTRRSAGLPSICVAILSSNPGNSFFNLSVKGLQVIATRQPSSQHQHGESSLPQVHAMNCLKDILSDSRLAPFMEVHLESTLAITVLCLNHKIWSIRNCGGMLMKAIINRLTSGIGVTAQDDHKGHRSFSQAIFSKYLSLGATIEKLLKSSIVNSEAKLEDRQAPLALPAAELIERIGIPNNIRTNIKTLLFELLGSPVWLLRERFALTLAQLEDPNVPMEIINMLKSVLAEQPIRTNKLHGLLLCLQACAESEVGLELEHEVILSALMLFEQINNVRCAAVLRPYYDTLTRIVITESPLGESIEYEIHAELASHIIDIMDSTKSWGASNGTWLSSQDQKLLQYSYDRLKVHLWIWSEGSHASPPESFDLSSYSSIDLYDETTEAVYQFESSLIHNVRKCCSWTEADFKDATFIDRATKLARILSDPSITAVFDQIKQDLGYKEGLTWPWTGYDSIRTGQVIEACQTLRRQGGSAVPVSLQLQSAFMALNDRIQRHEPHCIIQGHYYSQGPDVGEHREGRYVYSCCKVEALPDYWYEWALELQFAMCNSLDESLRLAVIDSIDNIKHILRRYLGTWNEEFWTACDEEEECTLQIVLVILYDALTDDDCDVREFASEVVAYILPQRGDSKQNTPSLSVHAAKYLLLQNIKNQPPLVAALQAEALSRLLHLPLNKNGKKSIGTRSTVLAAWIHTGVEKTLYKQLYNRVGPIVHNIQDTLYEDPSLFEEERQNLYKDMVEDMEWWAEILLANRKPKGEFKRLYEWALFGLEKIERSDGTPGWMRRRDGFEAVCRVLILAQVVQRWSKDLEYLKRLRDAVILVEERIEGAHSYHKKLFGILKSRFTDMGLDEETMEIAKDLHNNALLSDEIVES